MSRGRGFCKVLQRVLSTKSHRGENSSPLSFNVKTEDMPASTQEKMLQRYAEILSRQHKILFT